ncbi:hypothetical protein [Acidisphaera rubrifaciens]|uniref:Uncharacterized protein n=1 Tax=Acidisphaera rubrifaciens HS-AP3 TaxID=1231350 RepID=A0A0D6P955_9PROT|nr:hypothetical protein [Acidisphaera rubrifaciens]GAN78295.1 hypothetical protein Asru_0730_01 [Acidisphaera rubrifaciens HS-AP3]
MSAQCPRKRRATAQALAREFGITVDGRSRQARALRRFRADLVAHVGGKPNAAQEALIASLCQLRLRLLALDQSFATRGAMTETESRHYRGWVSTFHAGLRELGLDAAPAPRRDIRDILADRAAGR